MPTGRAQPGGRPARSHRQRSPRPRSPVRLPPPPGNLALKEKAAWRRTRKSQDRRRRCGRPLSSFSTCRLARIVGHRTQGPWRAGRAVERRANPPPGAALFRRLVQAPAPSSSLRPLWTARPPPRGTPVPRRRPQRRKPPPEASVARRRGSSDSLQDPKMNGKGSKLDDCS
nr:serine/arginine repetitive matrix protein 1 [Oryctolagus cuniculus]